MNSMLWPKPLLPAICMDPIVGGDNDRSSISSFLPISMFSDNTRAWSSIFFRVVHHICNVVNQLSQTKSLPIYWGRVFLGDHMLSMPSFKNMKGFVFSSHTLGTIFTCLGNMPRTWLGIGFLPFLIILFNNWTGFVIPIAVLKWCSSNNEKSTRGFECGLQSPSHGFEDW